MVRKLILFAGMMFVCLLSFGNIAAHADVLPPSCEDSRTSSQCEQDRKDASYCRVHAGPLTDEDLEVVKVRNQEKRCGGPGIPGETTAVSGSCRDWIKYCDSPMDVARAPWLYIGFVITVLVEGLVLLVSLRPFPKRRLPLVVAINAVTYIPLVFGLTWISGQGASSMEYRVTAAVAEGMVVLVEMLAIAWLFRISARKALIVSLVANGASIAVGLMVRMVLVS